MGRSTTFAIAVLLLVILSGAMMLREKCRLGNIQWTVCSWAGLPTQPMGTIKNSPGGGQG
jgi:hypothetical protein